MCSRCGTNVETLLTTLWALPLLLVVAPPNVPARTGKDGNGPSGVRNMPAAMWVELELLEL